MYTIAVLINFVLSCIISEYAINSVLFQRGLYPPETFKAEQQYGITLLISEDAQIKSFLTNLLTQSEGNIFFKYLRKDFSLSSS